MDASSHALYRRFLQELGSTPSKLEKDLQSYFNGTVWHLRAVKGLEDAGKIYVRVVRLMKEFDRINLEFEVRWAEYSEIADSLTHRVTWTERQLIASEFPFLTIFRDALAEGVKKLVARCWVTGNLAGTDLYKADCYCSCKPCRDYETRRLDAVLRGRV